MSVEGPNKKILEIWDRLTDDYSEVSREEFEYIQFLAKKYPQWNLPEFDEDFEIWSEGRRSKKDKHDQIWEKFIDEPRLQDPIPRSSFHLNLRNS